MLKTETHFPNPPAQRPVGEYYITMGMSPEGMANKLERIAERLNITLYAELFPKKNEE